jgi:hypothetical protein
MRRQPAEMWPDALFLLGDQVYADEVSMGTREFIRSRRDTSKPPGESIGPMLLTVGLLGPLQHLS